MKRQEAIREFKKQKGLPPFGFRPVWFSWSSRHNALAEVSYGEPLLGNNKRYEVSHWLWNEAKKRFSYQPGSVTRFDTLEEAKESAKRWTR